ncbi:MAG TPA: hypothetical protein VK154_20665 [Chitinophagales bacterium]|nr:hypothetical protein [Chitinophagales bacterium]
MATLKQLHELIHALDKNEKKFLSLMIEGIGGKAKARYADAFQIINSGKIYESEKLRLKLAGGVNGMNVSEANTNFYGFVCKALVAYYGTEAGNIGINKKILLIEILCTKALYDTANKMIDELIPIVQTSGTFAMQHRLFELKNNIYINNSSLNKKYKERYQYYDARIQALQDNLQSVQITRLNTQFFELAHTVGDPRNSAQHQKYVQLSKDPLLQLSVSSINKRSLATYIQLKLSMEVLSGSKKDVFELCELLLDEIRHKSAGQEQLSQEYFIADFMAGEALQLAIKKKAYESIRIFEDLDKKTFSKGIKQKILARTLMVRLTIFLWEKDYTGAERLLNDCMAEDKKKQWTTANLAYVNFLLAARIMYLAGKPDKALDYLLMMEPFEKILRPNIHISYRFLFLLCHYNLKNYQFLTYSTESLYRLLLKMDKLYAPERALLRFVKTASNPNKLNTAINKLYNELMILEADRFNKPFFAHGDYKQWLSAMLKLK